jgi:hypothetical protein
MPSRLLEDILLDYKVLEGLSYGHPWAHYSGGYQDRLLGGLLGLLNLCYTCWRGVQGLQRDSTRLGSYTCPGPCKVLLVVHD